MRVRATLVLDMELPDALAQEKYGTVDPYAACQKMEAEAGALGSIIERDDEDGRRMTLQSVTLTPVYG